jgi:hypothetical protein
MYICVGLWIHLTSTLGVGLVNLREVGNEVAKAFGGLQALLLQYSSLWLSWQPLLGPNEYS